VKFPLAQNRGSAHLFVDGTCTFAIPNTDVCKVFLWKSLNVSLGKIYLCNYRMLLKSSINF